VRQVGYYEELELSIKCDQYFSKWRGMF